MKAQNKSRQPVTATASLKSGEDRIVRALFSHLVRCIRFESKDVATQSLTIKWLVVVICGCLGAFGIGISTNLAQSATLALWLVLPLAAVAIRQSKAAPASYTRFSSENQNERSITDQQRKCRNRASSDGRPISPELEFFDEAQSGARHDRAGFEKMLAAARAGLITDLYFESLSRLARDCVLTLQVLRELVYVYKTRIVSVDEGLDTAVTANWELLAAIFGIQHEQFLKTLSAQVFRAQEGVVLDMLSVGDYCLGFGGEPVPGTESKRRGKEPVPKSKYIILWAEAEWVIKIFVWFVKERRSLRWIALELNRLGAPKDHRATTPLWYPQLLPRLLSNRKHIGQWPWGERQNVRCPISRKVQQVKRPSAESEKWLRHFPELQIIDDTISRRPKRF